MIPHSIKNYLEERGVSFQAATHKRSLTAQATAARTHISGKRFGKTVVLKRDGQYLMLLLPANEFVDLDALRARLGSSVKLASEAEIESLFPDCECGAAPPLGSLYGLPVIADACLSRQQTIAVNGGTHTDVIELAWDDYVRAEHPRLIEH